MTAYRGRCHCGAIGYEYETAVAPADWPIRACQCSFCRKHGAAYTSDPNGTLQWIHADASLLSRYRFGHETADFVFCVRCGGYLGAVTDEGGQTLMVINTRSLDPRPGGLASAEPISHEGETTGDRNMRRSARWTPVISQGGPARIGVQPFQER